MIPYVRGLGILNQLNSTPFKSSLTEEHMEKASYLGNIQVLLRECRTKFNYEQDLNVCSASSPRHHIYKALQVSRLGLCSLVVSADESNALYLIFIAVLRIFAAIN
jgi:hypothetical protein